MARIVESLFVRRGPNKISSSPLLVDANGDGWPEIFVGGPVLRGLSWDGVSLPGWPRRGRRPFASSPAFGDISGDHRGNVVAGCDDGRVYAFHVDGERHVGWPVATGNDVFSTPALADLDRDGQAEVVVGSDDGRMYVVRGDGTVSSVSEVPNRPFVSASPTVLDGASGAVNGIVVGAWDGCLYLLRGPGLDQLVPLARADHLIWSSATSFAVQGLGRCLAFSADRVYLVTSQGVALPGWPRTTRSWMASSPTVAELERGAGARVVVGADRLYLWDLVGHLQPGWPKGCGDFIWASPLVLDVDGDGAREVLVASWDGRIYAFRADGSPLDGFPLWAGGAVFATPAVAALPSGGGLLATAAWDGSIRGWRLPDARFGSGDWLQFRGDSARGGSVVGIFPAPTGVPAQPDPPPAAARVDRAWTSSWAEGRGLPRIEVQGVNLAYARRCVVEYVISGTRRVHISPVVHARDKSFAIVQALRRPHRIRYHVSYVDGAGNVVRWPERGENSFTSAPVWVHKRPREPLCARSYESSEDALTSPNRGGSTQ